ncbi:MAG: hypothetical protein JNM81_09430 [Rhodospirillaceae bacterium]|nr:hypothetical protein [Rhodospirillaceae bacterium]
MFPTRTLLKLLAVLEEELDANQFTVGNLHLWPALRFLLATKLQDNDQSKPRTAGVVDAEAEIERRFEALIQKSPSRADVSVDALRQAIPKGPVGQSSRVLVFVRADDHNLKTARGYYAPVTDPWAELLTGRWPYVKAEFPNSLSATTQPRHVMTLHVPGVGHDRHKPEDLAQCAAMLQVGRVFSVQVIKWLAVNFGIGLPELTEVLENQLTSLWLQKMVYRSFIQSVQPGLVLVTCYYFPPSIGMVWAARELGVPVADIQHGGNGAYHIGYTHWRHLPPGGYQLLPDYFFVWDNLSANNILRWQPPGATANQPLLTGRFGLDYGRRAAVGDGLPPALGQVIQGGEKTILVTLQTLASTGLSPLLLEAMRTAPPTWTWLVRGHPIAQAWCNKDLMPDALNAALKAAGVARYETQLTTTLPLAALLPHVNHHVTGFSGTVQECAAYGVRTTFTHPTVWSFFGNYIEMGAADFAATAEELVASIAANKQFPDLSAVLFVPREDNVALGVLSQILKAT